MRRQLKKVVVTGPESTGKSTLVRQLADYFSTSYVIEYARSYLNQLDRSYNELDLVYIAKGQLDLEKKVVHSNSPVVFYDTDLLTIKIWSDVKYSRCDTWIIDQLKIHQKDFYLLCSPDLPWEPDPLREHPSQLQELFELYEAHLKRMETSYAVIKGQGTERFDNAVRIIQSLF